MGKIRTVKPELFTHEDLYALEMATGLPVRLAFAGMFTCCDREGRFKWKPKTLKLGCLPHDDLDFSRVLDALWTAGFLVKYGVDFIEYGFIPTWKKHQFINNRETESELPEPHESLYISAPCTHHPRVDDATRGEGKGREGKGIEGLTPLSNSSTGLPEPEIAKPGNSEIPDPVDLLGETIDTGKPTLTVVKPRPADIVFEHWKRVMAHPQAKLDNKRLRAISARLKDGYTVDQLMQAVDGCRYSPHHQGANDRQTVYDDIELICRDGPHVDGFLKIASRGPPRAPDGMSDNTRKQVDNLKRYMENHPDD